MNRNRFSQLTHAVEPRWMKLVFTRYSVPVEAGELGSTSAIKAWNAKRASSARDSCTVVSGGTKN